MTPIYLLLSTFHVSEISYNAQLLLSHLPGQAQAKGIVMKEARAKVNSFCSVRVALQPRPVDTHFGALATPTILVVLLIF